MVAPSSERHKVPADHVKMSPAGPGDVDCRQPGGHTGRPAQRRGGRGLSTVRPGQWRIMRCTPEACPAQGGDVR